MPGEAAEEMVRIVLDGTEIMVRVTGSAAMSMAKLLKEWTEKKEGVVKDRNSLYDLLKSGDRLKAQSMSVPEYRRFREASRNIVITSAFMNRKEKDGPVVLVFRDEDEKKVMDIMMISGVRQRGFQKKTQSRENSEEKGAERRTESRYRKRSSVLRKMEGFALKARENGRRRNARTKEGRDR